MTLPAEVDLVIVGCGPVGALMGNLLGARGLRVAILEREDTPHGTPRAFSCDDEALRVYQQAGLADRLLADMIECPEAEFVGGDGRPFAVIRFAGLDFGSGFHGLNFFHQPALEAVLREGLARFPTVSLHLGHEALAIDQRDDSVAVTIRPPGGGAPAVLRARYALGCDGRRSAARRLAGIEMAGDRYEEPWIAISGEVDDPPPTMPSARFVCDPHRPGFVARGAMRQCRWEFMLRPGETADTVERPEAVARFIAPYVDPARVRIERASIYTFEAKTAARWRSGRLLLLGDAAHTMPPMMGQGLVSGLRDAANLAWKLDLVLRDVAGEKLLESYEVERRPHVEAMTAISRRIGMVMLVRDPRAAAARDMFFRALGRIPRARRFFRDVEFKPPATLEAGAFVGGGARRGEAQGTLFPQPMVRGADGREVRLDDALGPGFAVLGMGVDPRAVMRGALWGELGARFLRVVPAGAAGAAGAGAGGEGVIEDVDGRLRGWFERYRARVVVIRPDRYVFGAVDEARAGRLEGELRAALR